ncbi:MAG: PQQ-dependent sugar dehydrogenase [Acidobacteria bacterium]|nr:PQQ-dependent sugar dehydrogenase [Acidobacteriota bacterium]MBI3423042.1 PQQ-dependent sugar dehydrogenase [Acidobacteriota bacterium]
MFALFTIHRLIAAKHRVYLLWCALVMLQLSLSIQAATLPAGFSETQVGGAGANLSNPTAMAFAPDGRLFVCQQTGSLRVIKAGALLATPFVTLTVNSSGERGLLGIAFDPNFSVNQFVYVYYTTATAPLHNRVSRFTANGDVAVAGSETVLLDLDNLSSATNHNGGALHFGPDGKLYIAVGENATASNAQSLGNLLGKMLRLNADGSIPADNPFLAQTTGRNQAIWALGLRNPFTFGFQPGAGRMFINDVGQNTWEEINDGLAGLNYGWPTCEGTCNVVGLTNPIYQYANDASTCAITGGTFYNPATALFPAQYVGKYFFADFCAGWIHLLNPANNSVTDFATGLSSPVDLQVGPDGALYYLQRGAGGQVWRVAYSAVQPPPRQRVCDFDGDGKTDFAIWRGPIGNWQVLNSANGMLQTTQWGTSAAPYNDVTVPGDYDGDGKTDHAIWRGHDNIWYIRKSSDGQSLLQFWGANYAPYFDVPTPGDFDGDGKTDLAVWRSSTGVWYVKRSSDGGNLIEVWGQPGDLPLAADYDGDGKTDFAYWRPDNGTWYIKNSGGGTQTIQWGAGYAPYFDTPVPADYDGDGKTDVAIWRGQDSIWYIRKSSDGQPILKMFGASYAPYFDVPVPADYDGDGQADIAVWRPPTGTWYVWRSTNGAFLIQPLGQQGDTPVPATGVR